MGTCCVSGCSDVVVDVNKKTLTTKDGKVFKEGDYLSLDGSTGNVYGEEIKTVPASISGNFETFMNWADELELMLIIQGMQKLQETSGLKVLDFAVQSICSLIVRESLTLER